MKRDTKITIVLGLSLATLLIVLDIIGVITLTY
jgi:hypothetical protein